MRIRAPRSRVGNGYRPHDGRDGLDAGWHGPGKYSSSGHRHPRVAVLIKYLLSRK